MAKSFAEAYAFCCASAGEEVQKRLGRDLTSREQRCIWNTGSLMMLESVEQGLMAAHSPADMEQQLRAMEAWTEDRFQRTLAGLLERLPTWLGRAVTDAERAALAQSDHLGVFLRLAERLADAPPAQRETLLREATMLEAEPGKPPPTEDASGP